MGNKLISTKHTVPYIIIPRITQWVGFMFGMSIPTGMHSRAKEIGEIRALIINYFFFAPKLRSILIIKL